MMRAAATGAARCPRARGSEWACRRARGAGARRSNRRRPLSQAYKPDGCVRVRAVSARAAAAGAARRLRVCTCGARACACAASACTEEADAECCPKVRPVGAYARALRSAATDAARCPEVVRVLRGCATAHAAPV
eukprot:377348-Pleurochrysis_carterae.AAC.1